MPQSHILITNIRCVMFINSYLPTTCKPCTFHHVQIFLVKSYKTQNTEDNIDQKMLLSTQQFQTSINTDQLLLSSFSHAHFCHHRKKNHANTHHDAHQTDQKLSTQYILSFTILII